MRKVVTTTTPGFSERLTEAAKQHPRETFGDVEWKVPVEKADIRAALKQLSEVQGLLRESYDFIVDSGLWEKFLG